jgi:nucleoside-diphosphate-sugar epimerase
MEKAAVTGAAGFIGSHIVDELIKQKVNVIGLDCLSPDNIPNLAHLKNNPYFEYKNGQLEDYAFMEKIFSGVEYIFHEAAQPNPPSWNEDLSGYYKNNSEGMLNVLQAASKNRVKKVVFASSAAVYGDITKSKALISKSETHNSQFTTHNSSPGKDGGATQNSELKTKNSQIVACREDMLPNPQTPYAVCKLINEHYCEIYNRIHGLKTVCLRYFNPYGPRQNPNSPMASLIAKFIDSLKKGQPITIMGDGEQTRDFIYIKDIARANILFAENDCTGIYNIGSGVSVSLNELVNILKKILCLVDAQMEHKSARPGDIKGSLADISKARVAGFKPMFALRPSLQRMFGSKSIA